MLEQIRPLWNVFLKNKKDENPLVMATIVNTFGSSYKKKGAMVIIDSNLKTHGLISGGCLENDLAEHAESVFADKDSKILDYDLSDDSIFGLGAGCDGSIQVLLQLLNYENDYRPFSLFNPLLDQARNSKLLLNYNPESDYFCGYQFNRDTTSIYSDKSIESDAATHPNDYCTIELKAPLKVAIIGSGIDVIPICQQIDFMNWHGYVLDHRESRLQKFSLYQNIKTMKINLKELEQSNDLARDFDAVLLVTHNIDRDAQYLAYFNQFNIPYIGLLGPINRRDKVLAKAGLNLSNITNNLYAPVGLDIGCNAPEHIALSIIAEIQLKLNNYRTHS
jgi:xanthine/CO dehydrogenase XdhC/CoxF family maturation factor